MLVYVVHVVLIGTSSSASSWAHASPAPCQAKEILHAAVMSLGKIHCICFATKAGEVVYERFYDRLSELEKAEVRAAFALAASNARLNVEDQDYVGAYK
jgi:hypothetical protein